MSRFTYLFVGIVFGGFAFLTSSLFGQDLVPMILSVPAATQPELSGVAGVLAEPLAWLLLNPTWAAVMTGVFWPVMLFWLGLTGAVSVIGVGYASAFTLSFGLGFPIPF